MSFHVGESFGDYQITGIIGAGSMGQVFQAEHRITKRKEAVKVVAAEYAADRQIQRFQREIAVQAALNHPNIAAVHNALKIEGRFALIMEYIEGQTLEHLLQSGRLPLDTGVGYISQTLEALGYAHARGVIHRDVTPANLIVTSAGIVKLTDFGVAKAFGDVQLTNCGEVVGSLQYMAPEQISGRCPPDPRSDLYSVGAILYEIVTGRKPFDESALLPRLTLEEPELKRPTDVDGSLWPEWDVIIGRALVKDPAERYQSADEFLAALPGGRLAPKSAAVVSSTAKPSIVLKTAAMASVVAVALLAAGGIAVKDLRVAPSPQAVTFRIAPPELAAPAPTPVVSEPVHVPNRTTSKKQAARRIHKKKEVAKTRQSVNSQPLKAETQVQAVEPKPVPARATPGEPAPQNPAPAATPSDFTPPKAVTAAAPVDAAPPNPVTQATSSESAPQNPTPSQKKPFWGKLNPFRKKKAETAVGSPQN